MGIEQLTGSEEPISKGKRVYEIKDEDQRALLLILVSHGESEQSSKRRADELKALVDTMGALTIRVEYIPMRQTNSATLIGSGKVEAIKLLVEELSIDVVIFDQGINPRVQRNLEKEMETCVIDRDEVILQIFADRAATKEANLQVELARLEYSLPRLTRRWTNLNRQKGGVKGTKGEGETQLELDRRQIQDRVVALKLLLEKVVQQRNIQRNQRMNGNIPTGAIVGYTNSGKSSLLNALTNAGVLVEDKLFATLDPTTRLVKLPGGEEILLSDTVGFISDLPHNLVDAFKSTLEEAKYADFLIIVCDASHPDMLANYATTVQVLEELGCTDKPAIVLANKMDKVEDAFAVSRLKSMYNPVLETSIKTGEGLDALLTQIGITLHELCATTTYLLPNTRHDLVAHIHRFGQVESIDYTEEGILVKSRIQGRFQGPLQNYRHD
ncbi:GTPase HflX [Sphaerochaeta globosa]|uniref:GTPase HflX n=1 Tax=Sphaerochaeta globosa (strain ATCC BAA-1886 / DSM 22777 / Buddy) TaxID=158189 RepID=F0RSY9_SPHGB|nr:GTPase HflX [Sphaerochaeta globosa]ADY13936.1 GTP-binding proten HflX [Sphaerochaeta globosa str. Buddy]